MVTVVITAFCSAVAGNVLSARVLREFQRAAGWFRDVMGTEEQCGRKLWNSLSVCVFVSSDCHSGHTSCL